MNTALKIIEKSGIEIIIFPSVEVNEKNSNGDYTAKGVYINFAQIGNKILLPQFGFKEDETAFKILQQHFDTIIPVNSNEIALNGGVLNCITWSIKQ